MVNQVQSQAGSLPDFLKWESCGRCHSSAGILGALPFPPPLHYGTAPFAPYFTLISSPKMLLYIFVLKYDIYIFLSQFQFGVLAQMCALPSWLRGRLADVQSEGRGFAPWCLRCGRPSVRLPHWEFVSKPIYYSFVHYTQIRETAGQNPEKNSSPAAYFGTSRKCENLGGGGGVMRRNSVTTSPSRPRH
ncbi:hypothetical protein PR048_011971 [Dryococelus australis]|uniref:Uncharacterized protein n=1 Tax=Dryococelus australis TaxID=614101 RepID=A0ABQ9HNU4_9NEOP|nr:hypothetical protein PR048_011971 [Dryococelus australis]